MIAITNFVNILHTLVKTTIDRYVLTCFIADSHTPLSLTSILYISLVDPGPSENIE